MFLNYTINVLIWIKSYDYDIIKSLVLYILYAGYLIQLLLNPKNFYYLNLIKKPTKILFS